MDMATKQQEDTLQKREGTLHETIGQACSANKQRSTSTAHKADQVMLALAAHGSSPSPVMLRFKVMRPLTNLPTNMRRCGPNPLQSRLRNGAPRAEADKQQPHTARPLKMQPPPPPPPPPREKDASAP